MKGRGLEFNGNAAAMSITGSSVQYGVVNEIYLDPRMTSDDVHPNGRASRALGHDPLESSGGATLVSSSMGRVLEVNQKAQ